MQYVFDLLRALGVEVLWDVDDWIGSSDVSSEWIGQHDTLFVILQLNLIYETFKDRESVFGVASQAVHIGQTAARGEITRPYIDPRSSSSSSTERLLAWESSTQLPETDRVLQQLNAKLTTTIEQQKQQDQMTAAANNLLLPSGRRPLLSFRTNDSTAFTASSDMGMLSHQRTRESAQQSREHIPAPAPATIAIHVSPSHQHQQQQQQLSPQLSSGGSPTMQTITNNGVTVSISVGSMAEMMVGESTSSPPSRQLQQSSSSSSSPIQQSSSRLLSRWKSPTHSHIASSSLRTSSSGRFSSVFSSGSSTGTKCDWVQHVSKDISHNVKLNQARAEAQAARQHVNNPPGLREKYAQYEDQHYSSSMLPHTLVSHSTESASMPKVSSSSLLRQSFPSGSPPKFRSSPSSSSLPVADPTLMHNSYYASSPGNAGITVGATSNMVSFSPDGTLAMDIEERQLFREIRDKERKIMQFEDERRQRTFHSHSHQNGGNHF